MAHKKTWRYGAKTQGGVEQEYHALSRIKDACQDKVKSEQERNPQSGSADGYEASKEGLKGGKKRLGARESGRIAKKNAGNGGERYHEKGERVKSSRNNEVKPGAGLGKKSLTGGT